MATGGIEQELAGLTHYTDRTGWPAGEWDSEPDRESWTTTAGLPGLAARGGVGAWCGYAAVDPGHPLYKMDYSQVQGIYCHGDLTYSGLCGGHICHVPEPGQPEDVWWLGFDTAHFTDVSPGLLAMEKRLAWPPKPVTPYWTYTYKNLAYVKQEVETLANQLAATPTN